MEVEWEYAARGKVGRRYPWGSSRPTGRHANFANRIKSPSPVGIYPLGMTPEGVCDLSGNVWEWCADRHVDDAHEPIRASTEPAIWLARVLRGGAFCVEVSFLRAAHRIGLPSASGGGFYGFRCVWDATAG